MALFVEGKLFKRTGEGSGGGGDQHNLGWYATQAALEEAHPTAEAGDWAIVGATDTVWIWDTDNSAWVDSDQKGQVTSVNGQTGVVVLSIPDAVQYSTMPTPASTNEGDIVQFTGTTDANYTNGYFYKCVSDGQNPATYSWTQVNVQPAPSGLPDQTGQSGKFLTTDGTDASWATINALQNTATGTDSLTVLGTVATFGKTVNIGSDSSGSARCTVIGYNAGGGAGGATDFIAIGCNAKVTATNAIQIGGNSHFPEMSTNSTYGTVKIYNGNGNFEIMSADGTIPTDRLASTTGLADGNYRLRLVMASGVPTLEWVAE